MRVALSFIAFLGLLVSISLTPTTIVRAHDHLPHCGDEKTLKKVVKRFNQTERIYWRERGLILEAISKPHHHSSYSPFKSQIDRQYCHGTAVFENGKSRRLHYLIESTAGFAGFGWNVEYCIHGLDPWKYYDGRCRVLSR